MPLRVECSSVASLPGVRFLLPRHRDAHYWTIWQIAGCKFMIFVLASFFSRARDVPCFEWVTDAMTRIRGAHGAIFQFLSPVLRLFTTNNYSNLFHDLPFSSGPASFGFTRSEKIDWLEFYCVGLFPYSLPNAQLNKRKSLWFSAKNNVLVENFFVRHSSWSNY